MGYHITKDFPPYHKAGDSVEVAQNQGTSILDSKGVIIPVSMLSENASDVNVGAVIPAIDDEKSGLKETASTTTEHSKTFKYITIGVAAVAVFMLIRTYIKVKNKQ